MPTLGSRNGGGSNNEPSRASGSVPFCSGVEGVPGLGGIFPANEIPRCIDGMCVDSAEELALRVKFFLTASSRFSTRKSERSSIRRGEFEFETRVINLATISY